MAPTYTPTPTSLVEQRGQRPPANAARPSARPVAKVTALTVLSGVLAVRQVVCATLTASTRRP